RFKPSYHGALEPAHGVADAQAGTPQVEERIHDELPGAMIRDLPAAIDFEYGDAVLAQHMLAPPCQPERVDGRVLGEPELVAGRRSARRGERLHRAPGRLVCGRAQFPYARSHSGARRRRHQSTITTCGCADNSR